MIEYRVNKPTIPAAEERQNSKKKQVSMIPAQGDHQIGGPSSHQLLVKQLA
jgi:hypothetical protein